MQDFATTANSSKLGIAVPTGVTGIRGSGVGRTVFAMTPHSSTEKHAVPTRFPETNRLELMRIGGNDIHVSGLTLQGTDQGHPYNGLFVGRATYPVVDDIKVTDIPGTSSAPPGETFGLDDYRTTHARYVRVEIDGGGVGASGFGANASSDITLDACYFHGNDHSMGATFWEVHDIAITDSIATDNGFSGFNFERVSGTVRMLRPVTHGNTRSDIRIASDRGSASYRIVDPVYAGSKLTILLPRTYYGHPNLQKRSQIHVIVHGVDRTAQIVRFTTS